jgi:hypothetical protein
LKSNPTPAPLPELPHDQSSIPEDWLALVSWNIQTGGTSPTSTNNRPRMVATALGTLFSGTYQLLAAQEIPNSEAADYLRTLLPGGSSTWQASFFDTSDSMDNGFWYRSSITLRDSFPRYAHSDGSGRLMNDSSKAVHPPQVAQFEAGDFDFTLITLHLTFAEGNASESVRELREVLEYVDWYFSQPDHDPDVIICGDFNIPRD